MGYALMLARAGYYGGDPRKVLEAPIDDVMAAIRYEEFNTEFEAAMIDLNREP